MEFLNLWGLLINNKIEVNMEELINKLSNNFYVKSSKGNLLFVQKDGDNFIVQGRKIRRPQDIEYLNKEYEQNKKDIEKQIKDTLEELEYGLWDSGQLSIKQQEILDYLLKEGKIKREPGIPGVHDTFNGVAKYIYTLNETEEDERKHRLHNKEKSDAAKIAWKRHHSSYMRGTRKRQRNMENRTFYGIAKELESKLTEAEISKDNVFEQNVVITFNNISGGISVGINKENQTVSISCTLPEHGSGAYKLLNVQDETALQNLYTNLKEDLLNLCNTFDQEIQQIISKNGLKSTK